MISELTNKKSFIVKPTMNKFSDKSQAAQVAAINFKHAKVGKSFIPNVPVNYTCSKKQKAGKSFIPRFTLIHSKQTKKVKNEKPSFSHVNGVLKNLKNLKKDKPSISREPVKNNRKSYIPRRVTKKVAPLQENSQQMIVAPKRTRPTSKIPVPISTISTISTKKPNILANISANVSAKTSNRTIHSRTCSRCASTKKVDTRVSRSNTIKNNQSRVSRFNTIKNDQSRVSHFNANAIKDDQARVSNFDEIQKIQKIQDNAIQDDQVRVLTSVESFDAQIHVLTFDVIKKDDASLRASTTPKSLIPVRNLTQNLFKKRVSPLQPSTLTSVKEEIINIPTFPSNKKQNKLAFISFRNKHTQLQKSVNISEASISIVEISTTTLMIKPELSSISLLHKAEKDLSSKHQVHQIEDNKEGGSSLFGNVVKSIVRFSKDLFSKMI